MDKYSLKLWFPAIAIVLVVAGLMRDPYFASIFNLVAISALVAVSLRFVMLMGEVNFATAAFAGIGAYSAGAVTTMLNWPFTLAIVTGGIVAGALSILFGVVTLRIKGPYFLLIGFAFTEAVRILYSKIDAFGGNSGMVGIFPPVEFDPYMPIIVTFAVLMLVLFLHVLERSDFGKILTAIRDNENVARTVGINVLLCKVACFAAASFAAGVAGGLHAFVNNVISPGDFSFLLAAFALAYVKVGGEDSILGPIIGAIVLVVLGSYALGLGGDEHIFYGAAIVLSVLLLPQGVTGIVRTLWLRRAGKGA